MTALTFLARSGPYSLAHDPETGEPRIGAGEHDIYAHVWRERLHVEWEITDGPFGRRLASGRTWTRSGGQIEAIAAAHSPDVQRRAREARAS